jgi:hypothetical protein
MKSAEFGTREAAIELPFMIWLDDHQGWFADFLRGSVGNVDEETVGPLDISHEAVAESWWRSFARGGTHYGIRPFRTDPYAYVSHEFTDGNDTILLAHARYYYDHFVPIASGLALDFGSAYQFGQHDARRLVVKLLKEFKNGGVAHLGFEVRDHPTLIAGISFTW